MIDTKALREKVLDLAIRGKLVPQDPNDEPATVLLERIREQKKQMVKDGKLKAKDIKNDTIIFKGDDNLHYEQFADGTVKCIEDEIPFEIPESWSWARLRTIFETITGGTPSTKDLSLYGNEYPFYKPTDLDAGYTTNQATDMVSEKGFLSGRIVCRGSVLVTCIGATIGKTGYIWNPGICNQQINAILPNELMFSEYAYFVMCSEYEQNQIKVNASATTLPILNKGKFDKLLFPVAPYKVQIEIAKKVKNTFSFVDSIEKDKNDLKSIIEQVKSKILDLAIRGKLVPQNPDDEPASVLLDRIRAEKEELIKSGKIKRDKKESVIFKGEDNSYYEKVGKDTNCINEQIPFELPASWCWCRLGSIFSHNTGKALNSSNTEGRLLTYITTSNLYWDRFELETLKEMLFTDSEIEKYTVKKGDLLVCEGGDIGRSAIWCYDDEMRIQNHIHRLRPYVNLSNRFYYYVLWLWKQIGLIGGQGIGLQGFSSKAIHNLIIPLPPLNEQNRITHMIDELLGFLDTIEQHLS